MLKFSIITVTLNSQENLEKCIKSVISQNYKNIEHLIVDGGSTDSTIDIIKKYKKKINYFISEKDNGIWHAMNKGLKKSSGDIVCFLNSDDVFYSNAINIVAKYFQDSKIDFLFGTVKKYKIMHGYQPWKIKFSFGFYTSHSIGFFIRKKKHTQVGYYNNRFLSADLDFFLRMILNHKLIGTSTKKNEIIGKFKKGGFSSKIKYLDHLQDLNRIRLNNKQNKFFVYFIFLIKIIKKPIKFINSL